MEVQYNAYPLSRNLNGLLGDKYVLLPGGSGSASCRDHAADHRRLTTLTESIKISGGHISSPDIQPHHTPPNATMPGDETRQLHSDESESEVEEEEEIPHIEVDVTKLTALSPEVISKQVCPMQIFCILGTTTDWL